MRVVADLLTHAARTGAAGGMRVAIAIDAAPDRDGAHVVLRLSDDGPTATPEQRAALFDPLRAVRTAAGGGVGIALCRQIVLAHGGTLAALERPGGGSVYALTLPAARDADGTAA